MSSTASKIYALVDCNNFYASCERLFAPHLKKKPIVVLSNNDGCVIARSEEAKAMGIPMGVPYFKIQDMVREKKLFVFSSNYALYGDLSQRVMYTLSGYTQEMEIYSIDEAFLSLEGVPKAFDFAKELRTKVIQNTGIPVGVGLGPTKVLAKMANKLSKKNDGVFSFLDEETRKKIFPTFPVENIWGIGSRSALKLSLYGIKTAEDFLKADELLVEKLLTITGKRVQMEMKGIPCLDLEVETEDRKQVLCSRGFGRPVTNKKELQEAVSTYLSRASERLRQNKLQCGFIHVFLQTREDKKEHNYHGSGKKLEIPTQELTTLNEYALKLLDSLYDSGAIYVKAGVNLTDLSPLGEKQLSLFGETQIKEEKPLSNLMDQINARFGRDTVKVASCGTTKKWILRSEFKSPAYTTRFKEIPVIKI